MKILKLALLLGLLFLNNSICAQYIWSISNSTSGTGCTSGGHCNVFDNNCNMYFISANNKTISKMDPSSGVISNIVNSSGATGTSGLMGDGGAASAATTVQVDYITIDGQNNLYLADGEAHKIRKIDMSTGIITTVVGTGAGASSGDGGPATAAEIKGPSGMDFDNNGNLFFADYDANVIRKVDVYGIISTFAGTGALGSSGDNGPATAATMINPLGIRFNADKSTLYFAPEGDYAVRCIDMSTNIVRRFAGNGVNGFWGDGGSATSAQISYANDVAIDNEGNVYIADNGVNNRIRKVNPSGIISTIAGDGTSGSSGDGGPATAAEIYPVWVNVDAIGNVYVSGWTGAAIRYICTPTTSNFTISSNPADGSTICGTGSSITYTVNSVNGGCMTFTWYKSTGSSYSVVGTGRTYTDVPTGYYTESVYCVATPSYNAIDNECTSIGSSVTSNTITINVVQNPTITGVDINTRCIYGSTGSTSPQPQITTTVAGGTGAGTYTYNWTPRTDNNVSLFSSADITSPAPLFGGLVNSSGTTLADYILTVTDGNGCSASKNITTHFITSGWDLASKDTYFDLYDEPGVSSVAAGAGSMVWSSPDI